MISDQQLAAIKSGSFLVAFQRDAYLESFDRFSDRGTGSVIVSEADPLSFVASGLAGLVNGQTVCLADPVQPLILPGNVNPGEVLIPTSGTTGTPRLVRHTWETLHSAAHGLYSYFHDTPLNSICVLPLWHVGGWMQVVRAIVSEGQLCLWDWKRLEMGDWPAVDSSVNLLSLVPTQLTRLLDRDICIPSLKAIILGGAGASPDTLKRFMATGLPIRLSYGMTETAAMVTLQDEGEFKTGQWTAGRLLSHVHSIEAGKSSSAPKSIRIDASSLFLGYVGFPDRGLSHEYQTNDIGYMADGRLSVTGRSDRIINTGGEKVDPASVEAALLAVPQIREAVVVGVSDSQWGERVVALVVGELDPDILLSEVKATLPAFSVPKEIRVASSMPLLKSGKIDYARVRQCFGE